MHIRATFKKRGQDVNTFGKNTSRFYLVVFFTALIILSLLPMFFYFSKYTKNPQAFRTQEKHYITIEVVAHDLSPYVVPLIKAGDTQIDYNGEINVEIISVKNIAPGVFGSFTIDENNSVDIVTKRREVTLLLKVRYDKVGDALVLHPGSGELRVGFNIGFSFPDYVFSAEIIKVNKNSG